MRGALIHGVLLAVMLVYGYRTWTRDKSVRPDMGSVVLWDRSENDLVSIEYKADKKIVKLERKGSGGDAYWWGSETTIETRPKATPPGAGSGSAGSAATGSGSAGAGSGSAGAGSGSAAKPPPVEEEEIGRKTREFPLGDAADKLIKAYAEARALRDLGQLNDKTKEEDKLVDTKTLLTVTFKDGARAFLVGGSVFGGGDRYILDKQSNKAYVLSRDLVSSLEIGESSLHLLDPRGFDANKVEQVGIEAGDRKKTFARVMSGGTEGQQVKTWGDPETKKGNQTAANFIDNANQLRPTEYASNLDPKTLVPVVRLTYKDDRGAVLGTLALYKHEKAGELPPGQDLDPANPPKGEIEYYVVTEKTRVPGLVRKDTAQRTEQDIETVFSNKPPPEPAQGSNAVHPDPRNPFKGGAVPPPQPAPAPTTPPAPAPAPKAGSATAAPPAPAPAPKAGAPAPPPSHGSAATAPPPGPKPVDTTPPKGNPKPNPTSPGPATGPAPTGSATAPHAP